MRKREVPKILIRELEKRDRDDIIDNYLAVYDEVKKNPLIGIGLFSKKPSLKEEHNWFKELLEKIRKRESFAFVAEVDGRVVGLCEVRAIDPHADYQHVCLLGILVRDGYRSMGIGSAMFEKVIRKAKERSYEILTLKVYGTNKHAQGLYKKFGFKTYGVLPKGIARGAKRIDEVLMYRRLSQQG
ncbi:Acetyltransferase (GNAT) family protein [uncultured archaeon]|nr:Acetyltransferase (GNAT) family protein [uncultured archaeon]